jgi:hypothetical protein
VGKPSTFYNAYSRKPKSYLNFFGFAVVKPVAVFSYMSINAFTE